VQTLSGIKHPSFQEALSLLKPAGRSATGRFLAEDIHLVEQALADSRVHVDSVFCVAEVAPGLQTACATRSIPLLVATKGLLAKLLGTGYETGVSAVAIVAKRSAGPDNLLSPGAVVLVGDRIQDPRNVGVLVRTADAMGCSGVLLSSDSADPWQRAAVRSTTGSILRTPVVLADDLAATLRDCAAKGARVVGSSGSATRSAAEALPKERPLLLVLGNEQTGISPAIEAACQTVVKIPMAPTTGADSLNVTVAAGMLVYEALR